MQVHVVLRMLAEILLVVIDRHLVEGQPAVVRFSLMSDQHSMLLPDEVEHRIEFRIVDHDQTAVRVAKLHADVFPYLDADRAVRECLTELADHPLLPIRLVPALHREGRRISDRRGMTGDQRLRDSRLLGQRREVRIVDIDGEQPKMVGLRLIDERRVRRIDVHMNVDLVDRGKIRRGK